MELPPPTPLQARTIWFAITGLAVAVLVGLAVGLVWGLGHVLRVLSPVLWPLAVGGVIACLLDPVVDWLEKRGTPRTRAILIVMVMALVIILALLSSVVPQLVVETRDLVSKVPAYTSKIEQRVTTWINNPPALLRDYLPSKLGGKKSDSSVSPPPADPSHAATNPPSAGPGEVTNAVTNRVVWEPATKTAAPPAGHSIDPSAVQSVTSWLARALPAAGSWVAQLLGYVASWFGVFAGLALVPIYAFYFLAEKVGIESKWTTYLPVSDSKFKEELVFILRSINGYLIAFFRGQVLVAICDGILYATGFLIIGLPYAVLIGAMAIALTMIPFLGAIIVCCSALLLALVNFGDWLHPLLVLGVVAVVQVLEGLVISPRIMGNRVGLHPLTIIIAVMAGTTLLGGLLGGILAIPLTAVLRVLMVRYVWKRPAGQNS